ncbi:transcriptional regulator [Streptococcus pseudopneumoniae]|uniref:Transcriptional regulator n=1 Tax=Streptococcus mitis TaxID=28037 RepID=A0A1X1K8H3_STRMT|nr:MULTISPECIES: helix-turn-helix transcriptional regulator [Streptococcus]ORO95730.1 transcriptional regulator [Streptococcus mitis]TMR42815.1 transcriptional regulator [Streptococcus pseudopneumoniae]TMR57550.1 transcriptional regulator [Streptococcus pseudopneumoniae]
MSIKTIRRTQVAKNLKLKLARVELDLTQGQLADAVGVTRQTIGLIEAGKYNPSLSLCQSICRCLGKTLDQLFWEEEDGK